MTAAERQQQPLSIGSIELRCPLCKGALAHTVATIACSACAHAFPQPLDGSYIDLLPASGNCDSTAWTGRQSQMSQWYADLIESPARASACFENDYEPYRDRLAAMTGAVLDLGGGVGVTRHYLPHASEYIVVDPSLRWLDADWSALRERYPCLTTPPNFVRGEGESLPFGDSVFDSVLAMWSLNHVADPPAVLAETRRVLKPGARALLVLEDMPPVARDLIEFASPRSGWRRRARWLVHALRFRLRHSAWELQPDHIRLEESLLRTWFLGKFEILERQRVQTYVTYTLRAA